MRTNTRKLSDFACRIYGYIFICILALLPHCIVSAATIDSTSEWESYPITITIGDTCNYVDPGNHQAKYYYYTFTTEATGIYQLSMRQEAADTEYFTFYTGGYHNGYTDSDFSQIEPIADVRGNTNKKYYLFEGNKTYKLCIMTTSARPESSITYSFSLKKHTASPYATLTDSKALTVTRTPDETSGVWEYFDIISFVPTKNGDIAIDMTGLNYIEHFYMIDIEAFKINKVEFDDPYNPTSAHVSMQVTAGNQYYLTMCSSEYDITFTTEYLPAADNSTVYTSDIKDLKSTHRYTHNLDKKWVYTPENAENIVMTDITFNEDTFFKSLWSDDHLLIYDADENVVGIYYDNELAGKTISIPGGSFTLRLVTDDTLVGYGFEVTNVTAHKTFPAPTLALGNDLYTLQHGLGKIYYKLSTDEENSDFIEYDKPFCIENNTTVYTYAKYNDLQSGITEFELKAHYVEPPEFKQYPSGTYYISGSGTVYRRDMLSDKAFSLLSSYNLQINESTITAAYSVSDGVKSDTVYFIGRDSKNADFDAPIITERAILGGKTVTISPPEGVELHEEVNDTNYSEPHWSSDCDSNHSLTGDFSHFSDKLYINVQTQSEHNNYTSLEPLTLNIYDDLTISANVICDHIDITGTWYETEKYILSTYQPYHDHKNVSRDNYTKTGTKHYAVIEVPKANSPIIHYEGTKLTISADNGLLIYYSINDGKYAEYTSPVTVKQGDIIKAYAIGYGISKSGITTETVSAATSNKLDVTVNTSDKIESGDKLPLKIKNYFSSEKGSLIVSIYDKDTNQLYDVQSKDVTLYTGTNYISFTTSFPEICSPYISVYFWDSVNGMKPITERINLPVNK